MYRNLLFFLGCAIGVCAADWNQWRGADRNGVVTDKISLLTQFDDEGPRELWKSDKIPSNDDGGHGSLVIWDNRVYMAIVWHEDIPSNKREINELVVRRLGFRNISGYKGLAEKIEKVRVEVNPRLRGAKFDEWADNWLKENLDNKSEHLSGWVKSRLKKGKLAVPYFELEKVSKMTGTTFDSDQDFKEWIRKEGFGELAAKEIIKAVPASVRAAKDVVVCIDGNTGKTLWRTEASAEPAGRKASSTPCVVDGKVFAAGGRHAYCVNAKTGVKKWSAELPGKGTASSFLVHEGKAYIMAGKLVALDAETGKELWRADKLSASNSSPVIWNHSGRSRLVVSARSHLVCLEPDTGEIIWQTDGGGESTPVVSGNWLVAYSKNEKLGLAGYKLTEQGAKLLWNHPLEARRTQSSPVIYQGHVYLAGGDNQMCVDLISGKIKWQEKRQSTISSPLIADGKFIVMEKKGSELVMLKASPQAHQEIAKTRVKAMWCPSPVLSKGRLYVRRDNHVVCFRLSSKVVIP